MAEIMEATKVPRRGCYRPGRDTGSEVPMLYQPNYASGRSVEERFWEKVEQGEPDECWLWRAYLAPNGYGRFWVDGGRTEAHRIAYRLLVGPIPEGLDIDHLCRNRACVNPAHLESVTRRENLIRGETIPARAVAKTHCKQGHEFTPENTYRAPNGTRHCKECSRAKCRRWYWAQKAAR